MHTPNDSLSRACTAPPKCANAEGRRLETLVMQHCCRGEKMDESLETELKRAVQRIDALAANERRLIDELWKALQQRDELRRALEIIAVGDAQNPQAQAAEELIALGWWRDIPEARTMTAAPDVGAA